MGAIHLPGLPAAYTNWRYCVGILMLLHMGKADAEVLAAIAGPESGYDYHIVNDTPSTGDYSVGLWQINYYGSLYAERSRLYGTPRELAAGGPMPQARAAYSIWRSQGWMAWATTYTSGAWRKYIGSGPIPHPDPGSGGGRVNLPPVVIDSRAIKRATLRLAREVHLMVDEAHAVSRVGTPGWRP
jgi:Lysozyme like domain